MRVLIVEAEPQTRHAIRRQLRRTDDTEVIAESDCGAAAITAVHRSEPDVVVIDAKLPDMSGFEALRSMDRECRPLAIVVAADAESASLAYDADAVDFLRKPLQPQRFTEAMRRVRERLDVGRSLGVSPSRAVPIPGQLNSSALFVPPRMLLGERQRKIHLLHVRNVDYIESHRNYVSMHVGTEEYLSRDTIKRLGVALAPHGYVRIERSKLLNLRAVSYVERLNCGLLAFALRSGAQVTSCSSYRAAILSAMREASLD
jgi:DNA-binding LytR/AlgR family response regulator